MTHEALPRTNLSGHGSRLSRNAGECDGFSFGRLVTSGCNSYASFAFMAPDSSPGGTRLNVPIQLASFPHLQDIIAIRQDTDIIQRVHPDDQEVGVVSLLELSAERRQLA